MRSVIAEVIGMPEDRIGVKATTTEGLGFEGSGQGISAHAIASLRRL
jgi:2C-methyl-D-erythritol 2,4-cyclodiphosphate synthase